MTLLWAKTIKLLGGARGDYLHDVGKDFEINTRSANYKRQKNDKIDIIKIKTLFIKDTKKMYNQIVLQEISGENICNTCSLKRV